MFYISSIMVILTANVVKLLWTFMLMTRKTISIFDSDEMYSSYYFLSTNHNYHNCCCNFTIIFLFIFLAILIIIKNFAMACKNVTNYVIKLIIWTVKRFLLLYNSYYDLLRNFIMYDQYQLLVLLCFDIFVSFLAGFVFLVEISTIYSMTFVS